MYRQTILKIYSGNLGSGSSVEEEQELGLELELELSLLQICYGVHQRSESTVQYLLHVSYTAQERGRIEIGNPPNYTTKV